MGKHRQTMLNRAEPTHVLTWTHTHTHSHTSLSQCKPNGQFTQDFPEVCLFLRPFSPDGTG